MRRFIIRVLAACLLVSAGAVLGYWQAKPEYAPDGDVDRVVVRACGESWYIVEPLSVDHFVGDGYTYEEGTP